MNQSYLKNIDRPFWILFIILIVVAIIALFSASSTLAYAEGSTFGPILKQVGFILIGIAVTSIIQFAPTDIIRIGGYALLFFSIICLYVMLIPGNPFVVRINDASRWFNLFGLQFQPSELAKLSLIIVVADILARVKTPEDSKRAFYITMGITVITCLPILMGNLSTAILLGGIVFIMWFLAKVHWKFLLSTIGILAVIAVLGYCIVEFGYVRPGKELTGPFSRATTWIGRIDDMMMEKQTAQEDFKLNDSNYQRSIAKVAVARGGLSPIGVLPGNSQERDFLPLAYADYIFAIIVEETGVVGAILLCFLYLAILFRACYASSKYADYSAMLMVMGLALMLTCQALISMAVAVGIGPVTGQPLPMISKGGTSVVITCLYFGIMMSVAREQNELKDRKQKSELTNAEEIPEIQID